MKSRHNPYKTGGPVVGNDFYGRDHILKLVERELDTTSKKIIMLHGQRRVGKTSIERHLEASLSADKFLPVFFDLEDKAEMPINKLLANLTNTIFNKLGLELITEKQFDDQANFFYEIVLPKIFASIGDSKKLVLLLDEFEVLDREKIGEVSNEVAANAFYPFLRELRRKESRLVIIIALGRNPEDVSDNMQRLFKAVKNIHVGVLKAPAAEALVRQAESEEYKSLSFTEQAIGRILALTYGHPYLTQLLCENIWNIAHQAEPTSPPEIDVPDVETAIQPALDAGYSGIVWWWNGLELEEKLQVSVLARELEEGQHYTEGDLLTFLQENIPQLHLLSDIRHTPDKLVQRELLIRVEKNSDSNEVVYHFAIELYRRWIRDKWPLQKVLEVYVYNKDSQAKDDYSEGNKAFKNNNFKEAIRYFLETLQNNPDHFPARLALGRTYLKLNQYEQAIEALEKAFSISPNETRHYLVQALTGQAQAYETAGSEDGVLSLLERVLELEPDKEDALKQRRAILERRGDFAYTQGDFEKAIPIYEAAGAKEKVRKARREQQVQQFEREGERLKGLHNWSEAAEIYNQLLDKFPEHRRASDWSELHHKCEEEVKWQNQLIQRVLRFRDSGFWQEAINIYEQLLANYPHDKKVEEWKKALEECQTELKLETLFARGIENLNNRQPQSALETFKELISLRRSYKKNNIDVQVLFKEAKEYIRIKDKLEEQDKWDEAISAYEELAREFREREAVYQVEVEHCRTEKDLSYLYKDAVQEFENKRWEAAVVKFANIVRQKSSYPKNSGKALKYLQDSIAENLSLFQRLRPLILPLALVAILLFFGGYFFRASGLLTEESMKPIEVTRITNEIVGEESTELVEETPIITETVTGESDEAQDEMVEVLGSTAGSTATPPGSLDNNEGDDVFASIEFPSPSSIPLFGNPLQANNLDIIEPLGQLTEDNISGLAESSDGTLLAASTTLGGIQLYKYNSETKELIPRGGIFADTQFTTLAFSPRPMQLSDENETEQLKSELLVAATEDGRIFLLDVEQDELSESSFSDLQLTNTEGTPLTDQLERERIHSITFSPDGLILASASDSGVELWCIGGNREQIDIADPSIEKLFAQEDVTSLAFYPVSLGEGNESVETLFVEKRFVLVSATGDAGQIDPWLIQIEQRNPDGVIDCQELGANGVKLTTGTEENQAGNPVSEIAFSANGQLFATASDNSEVTILWQTSLLESNQVGTIPAFNINKRDILPGATVAFFSSEAEDATLENGHTLLATATSGGEIYEFRLDVNGLLLNTTNGSDMPDTINFSPRYRADTTNGLAYVAGGGIVYSSCTGVFTFLDRDEEVASCQAQVGISKIAFSSNDEKPYFAAGSADGTIRIWNANTERPVPQVILKQHTTEIVDLAFSPNGQFLASIAAGDAEIAVWDLDNLGNSSDYRPQTLRPSFPSNEGNRVHSIAFGQAPTFSLLVAGTNVGTIEAWQFDDANNEFVSYDELGVDISDASFSSDIYGLALVPNTNGDLRLLAGFDSNSVRLLSPSSEANKPLSVDETGPYFREGNSFTFSSDGLLVAFILSDDSVSIWNLEPERPQPLSRINIDSTTSNSAESLAIGASAKDIAFIPTSNNAGTESVLAIVDERGSVYFFRIAADDAEQPITRLSSPQALREGNNSIAFSPYGRGIMITGTNEGIVKVWGISIPTSP